MMYYLYSFVISMVTGCGLFGYKVVVCWETDKATYYEVQGYSDCEFAVYYCYGLDYGTIEECCDAEFPEIKPPEGWSKENDPLCTPKTSCDLTYVECMTAVDPIKVEWVACNEMEPVDKKKCKLLEEKLHTSIDLCNINHEQCDPSLDPGSTSEDVPTMATMDSEVTGNPDTSGTEPTTGATDSIGDSTTDTTDAQTTGNDPTTGGPECDVLQCQQVMSPGRCDDPKGPITLEQFWGLKFPMLDEAFASCATDNQKKDVVELAHYLGLADVNTDPTSNATSCDEQALDQRIKEGPLQILSQIIAVGQSYTGGIQGVVPTKASWCGVSQKYPAAPVRIYAQEGPCNPDQPGQAGLPLNSVELKFLNPESMATESVMVDMVGGEAVVTNPLFYGTDGQLPTFNLVVGTLPTAQEVDICLAFGTVDGDMKTKVVGELNTFALTP